MWMFHHEHLILPELSPGFLNLIYLLIFLFVLLIYLISLNLINLSNLLDFREKNFHGEDGEAMSQLPRELWVPHPWRQLRPGWMGPWAAELVGGSPAHCIRLELRGLEVFSNSSHSMIL